MTIPNERLFPQKTLHQYLEEAWVPKQSVEQLTEQVLRAIPDDEWRSVLYGAVRAQAVDFHRMYVRRITPTPVPSPKERPFAKRRRLAIENGLRPFVIKDREVAEKDLTQADMEWLATDRYQRGSSLLSKAETFAEARQIMQHFKARVWYDVPAKNRIPLEPQ